MKPRKKTQHGCKRWRSNVPVVLEPGERPVTKLRIQQFAVVISNRSLFFAHAGSLDDEGNAPSVHQIRFQRA